MACWGEGERTEEVDGMLRGGGEEDKEVDGMLGGRAEDDKGEFPRNKTGSNFNNDQPQLF